MSELKIKVKQTSSNQTFEITISSDSTVEDLKKKLEEPSKLSPNAQNLIYKGRILANEKLLSDYNIQNEHVIILVKKYVDEKKDETQQNTNTSTNTNQGNSQQQPNPFNMFQGGGLGNQNTGFGGMGGLGGGMGGLGGMGGMNFEQMQQMMNNPMYQQAMNNVILLI